MNEPYSVELSDQAEKDLKRLSKEFASRIIRKLYELGQIADAYPHYALRGNWKGTFHYRVGDYRVLYRLLRDQRKLYIVEIGHRREVYE